MSDIKSIVIVHFEEGDSLPNYHIIGTGSRVFIVDDNAPHDRVYELTHRDPPEVFRQIIPNGSKVGHAGDARHAALSHQLKSFLAGEPALKLLEDDQ